MLQQNTSDAESLDVLRILLTFGADCRLKDKDGNNGKYIRFTIKSNQIKSNQIIESYNYVIVCIKSYPIYVYVSVQLW